MMAAVEWGYIAQAQQILAKRFAELGHKVIFIEPLPVRYPTVFELGKLFKRVFSILFKNKSAKQDEYLSVIASVGLPETGKISRHLNRFLFVPYIARKIIKTINKYRTDDEKVVIECWKPVDYYWQLQKHINHDLLVYSCIDNYAQQYRAPSHITSIENLFLESSDRVIAIADFVAKRLRTKRDDIYMRDAAVDNDLFSKMDNGPFSSCERICFYGAVSDRLDFDLLNKIASNGYQVDLVGPVKRLPVKRSELHKNIHFVPQVNIEDLPDKLQKYDALVLPYQINEYTKGIRLAKIYECFASGKPLISTMIPSLQKYEDIVYLAATPQQFIDKLKNLRKTESEEKYNIRKQLAHNNDWKIRVDEEIALFRDGISQK